MKLYQILGRDRVLLERLKIKAEFGSEAYFTLKSAIRHVNGVAFAESKNADVTPDEMRIIGNKNPVDIGYQ